MACKRKRRSCMSIRKDVRFHIAALENHGWVLIGKTGSGHFRLLHYSGASLICPSTPSCHRAFKNNMTDAKRAIQRHLELVR